MEPVWNPCRALWNLRKLRAHSPRRILWKSETLIQPYLKPPRTTPQPRGTLLEPCWNGTLPCKTWWISGGILMEHYLKPARTAGGTLVKPWWNPRGTFPGPRRTLEEIGGTLVEPNLVEPSWNLTSNHPGPPCSPGGTRVEPYLKPTQTTPQPGTLVEPWRNPRETFLKPAALEEIGGTLVEPSWNLTSNHPRPPRPCRTWWNPGGTLVEPWWNPGGGTLLEGTLVEPLVEPWWNLSSGSPRTTPEPIWAETPKLSAVGEKEKHMEKMWKKGGNGNTLPNLGCTQIPR